MHTHKKTENFYKYQSCFMSVSECVDGVMDKGTIRNRKATIWER